MDFTPLTPIGKSMSTGSTPPVLTQTSGPGMLPRIPQTVASTPKPVTPPALERTVKSSETGLKALPSPSQPQPVGINPPTLEKVAKPVKTASTATPADLRPSWPEQKVQQAKTEHAAASASKGQSYPGQAVISAKAPTLEVSKKVSRPATSTTPTTRFESPNGMYIITCDIHTMGCDSVTGGNGRKLIHGLFSYGEVMKMQGDNITDKLVNMVKKRMLDSFPPFLVAGISLGTAIVEVKYPVYDVTGDLVATIEVKSSDGKHQYRTLHIRRFRHDMFTAFQV